MKKSILLIEDNVADVELVTKLLSEDEDDFAITSANTIGRALKILEDVDRRQQFQAILLDLHLPDAGASTADGVRRVVAKAGTIPIIALTQLDDDAVAYECLEAGLQDFIRKNGLTASLLSRAIDHAIVRARSVEMARRLELAERHATLGSIASYVAHEINNQASLLLADLELTQGGLRSLDGVANATVDPLFARLEDGREAALRIGKIVRQLQVFSDRTGGGTSASSKAITNVGAVIERTITTMANRLRQSAILSLDLASPCAPAAIDEQRLGQVLVNLLRNAAEAIETEDPSKERITVRLYERDDSDVVIVVSDTGIGIRPEDRANVFRPFFSSKPDGIGLGLAISSELLIAIGGSISLSTPDQGKGATFTVTLPRANVARPKVTPPPRAGSSPFPKAMGSEAPGTSASPRLRLLMVDDDPGLRVALGTLMRRHHDVVCVGSGREALDLLSDSTPFDFVLCDLMMPGLDGTSVYNALKRDRPELTKRFALLTGGAFTPAAKALVDSGEVAILFKPCGYRDVLALLEGIEPIVTH
jgi:signal transduction histidine kinase